MKVGKHDPVLVSLAEGSDKTQFHFAASYPLNFLEQARKEIACITAFPTTEEDHAVDLPVLNDAEAQIEEPKADYQAFFTYGAANDLTVFAYTGC